MLRSAIVQALEFHLDADIHRQPNNVRDYWIALRLCRQNPATPSYQKKRPRLLLATETIDGLKSSIIETIISSQFDLLLAMAVRANQEAKLYEPGDQYARMAYNYKAFLLNGLILAFAEKQKMIAGEFDPVIGIPQLVIQQSAENRLVYDLRFFMGYSLFLYEDGKVVRYEANKEDTVGLHQPKNQLIPPVAKIIELLLTM